LDDLPTSCDIEFTDGPGGCQMPSGEVRVEAAYAAFRLALKAHHAPRLLPQRAAGRKMRRGAESRARPAERLRPQGCSAARLVVLVLCLVASGGSRKAMSENEARLSEVAERGEEQLRRVVAVYEARLTEIAELAAHVRHEINNPLTGLIGQAQLLLREELSSTARRRVETIEQLANRIRDTVASLREIQLPQPVARGGSSEGSNEQHHR
jgi:signal transduction histidine kinase